MKYLLAILFTLTSFGFTGPVNAQTRMVERIDSYDVSIEITEEGGVRVVEDIRYNFGENKRQGIIRDIPSYYFSDQGSLYLPYENVMVTNGKEELTIWDRYDGIRIGDEGVFLTGEQRYVISYEVPNVVTRFDDYDELTWDVIGDGWNVKIDNVSMSLTLPGKIEDTVCYTGGLESTEQACNVRLVEAGRRVEGTSRDLDRYEGFTVGVKFAHGVVEPAGRIEIDSDVEASAWYAEESEFGYDIRHVGGGRIRPGTYEVDIRPWDLWLFDTTETVTVSPGETVVLRPVFEQNPAQQFWNIFAALCLLGLSSIVLTVIWRRFGKDDPGREVIIAQYDPPKGVNPALAGLIADDKVHLRDITASLLQLAVTGYIRIERVRKEKQKKPKYVLHKLKEGKGLKAEEKQIFEAVFAKKKEVKLEDAMKSVGKVLGPVMRGLRLRAESLEYYHVVPWKARATGWTLGIVFGSAFIFASIFVAGIELPLLALVMFGSWLAFFIMTFRFGRRTQQGSEVREHVLGLKEYLNVVEKDRYAFGQTPTAFEKTLEQLLPYAVALKVEEQWARLFEEYVGHGFKWYQDPVPFDPATFASSMVAFGSAVPTAVQSAGYSSSGSRYSSGSSFSSGGGFSGGGFGGGGGSSW